MSRILEDNEFDRVISLIPSGSERGKLIAHNALLKKAVQEGPGSVETLRKIVAWIRKECGDADTVRANHARKLAERIERGEYLK